MDNKTDLGTINGYKSRGGGSPLPPPREKLGGYTTPAFL